MYDTKYWYNEDGKFHRVDGPAVEWINGDAEWYKNGKRHREDGPAIEYVSGYKEWWVNGVPHREDGPAIECTDGRRLWYFNGAEVKVKKLMNKICDPNYTPSDFEVKILEWLLNNNNNA